MMEHPVASVSLACLVLVVTAGCLNAQSSPAGLNTLTAEERAAGWRLLFDGSTTNGWRGYMKDEMPAGWTASDGALARVAEGGDIITTEKFSDFELAFEFRVEKGGNSGVFYRAIEGPDYIYYGAPEFQVLDDAAHQDGASPLTSTGANYALHPAQSGVARPAGEWNTARIVVNGNQVEHWLNGQKVVEYELGSSDWVQRVAGSKFSEWPEYGKAGEGHIGLQDHGDAVWYRNIKIRELR